MTSKAVSRTDIGAWIAAGRRLKGWTQQELGEALMARTEDETWANNKAVKVSKIERGVHDLSADTLSLIAELLQQPIEWFYQPLQPYTEPPTATSDIPRYVKTGRSSPVISLDDARAEKQRRERAPVKQAA